MSQQMKTAKLERPTEIDLIALK